LSYVHKPRDKTDFENVLGPDDRNQQNPCRRLTTADSTHLQAEEHKTYHVAGYNTMHMDVDTKYEITFNESEAYKVACQMDATIKTHLKEVKNADTESVDTDLDKPQKTQVTNRRGNTDDAEMLADSTYQQAYQEEDVDKTYPENTAAPRNITNDGPLNNGVPRQTGTEDVARRPAVPDDASEKGGGSTCRRSCAT
jgi:hypothetical protein